MTTRRKDKKDEKQTASELNERCWSVVTFESRAAKNLTYEEAAEELRELASQKVSGLCIVTDEAAEKISKKNLQG